MHLRDLVVDYSPYPRSKLVNEMPMGVGTGLVESLSSYFNRVRAVHSVTAYRLKMYVFQCAKLRIENGILTLDAIAQSNAKFAAALSELTMQPAVASLGLSRFVGIVSPNDCLKRYRVWCDECRREAVEGLRPFYTPLVWLLKSTSVCTIHRRLLTQKCHSCNEPTLLTSTACDDSRCAQCGLPVHRGAPAQASPLPIQSLVSQVMETFVERLQRLASEDAIQTPEFEKIYASAHDRGLCTSRWSLCQRAGVERPKQNHLAAGKKTSIETWIRLAMAAGLSPAGLFVPSLWSTEVGMSAIEVGDAMHRRRNRPVDWANVRDNARAQLTSPDPMSLAQLADHVDADERYMRRALGTVTQEVLAARRAAQTRALEEQVASLQGRIAAEAARLGERGRAVTARGLARATGQSHHTIVFGLAVRRVGASLGLRRLKNFGRRRLIHRHIDDKWK